MGISNTFTATRSTRWKALVRRYNKLLSMAVWFACGLTALLYAALPVFYAESPWAGMLVRLVFASGGIWGLFVGANIARRSLTRRHRIREAGHCPGAWSSSGHRIG